MRLGDEARGLSILATQSCQTLKIDAFTWQRWDSVFRGGLRAVLGSHGDVAIGGGDNIGRTFATYLNQGYALREAWVYAVGSTAAKNDVAVVFTGLNANDCTNRRLGMNWSNFKNYQRLRDNGFATWCWELWDDQ
jgi:hypothetical protein